MEQKNSVGGISEGRAMPCKRVQGGAGDRKADPVGQDKSSGATPRVTPCLHNFFSAPFAQRRDAAFRQNPLFLNKLSWCQPNWALLWLLADRDAALRWLSPQTRGSDLRTSGQPGDCLRKRDPGPSAARCQRHFTGTRNTAAPVPERTMLQMGLRNAFKRQPSASITIAHFAGFRSPELPQPPVSRGGSFAPDPVSRFRYQKDGALRRTEETLVVRAFYGRGHGRNQNAPGVELLITMSAF